MVELELPATYGRREGITFLTDKGLHSDTNANREQKKNTPKKKKRRRKTHRKKKHKGKNFTHVNSKRNLKNEN